MPSAAENLSEKKELSYHEQMMDYIQTNLPDRYTETLIYPSFDVENYSNAGNQKGHYGERLVYDVLSGIKKQPMVTLFSYESRAGEIDFVLIHMHKGVIVLEVKAWDKIVSRRKGEAESNIRRKVDGLYIKLQKSKLLRKKLLHRPRFGFVMPNISEQNIDGYCCRENVRDSQSFLQWLDSTFKDLENKREELIEIYDKTLCALFPVFVNKRSYDGITEQFIQLTSEQAEAVDGCPCHQVIAGPAGSGKTEVLISKVMSKELEDQRKLVLCFTRALSLHLKWNRLRDCKNVDICTFDKLTKDIVGGPFNRNESTYARVNKACHILRKSNCNWRGSYESIFVDEAQDLNAWNWEEVVGLLHNGGYLWVFYDSNQRTFAGGNPIDLTKAYTLKYVIRNTINVFEVSKFFYSSEKPIKVKHRIQGPVVDWIPVQSQDFLQFGPETMDVLHSKIAEVATDLREIQEPGAATSFAPGDVTILLNDGKREDLFFKSLDTYACVDLRALLLKKFNAENMVEAYTQGWPNQEKSGITISTVHKFKGLESKVVILLLQSDPWSDKNIQMMYVGITRTFCKLIIIYPDCYEMHEMDVE